MLSSSVVAQKKLVRGTIHQQLATKCERCVGPLPGDAAHLHEFHRIALGWGCFTTTNGYGELLGWVIFSEIFIGKIWENED
jgi:hypothetical protein